MKNIPHNKIKASVFRSNRFISAQLIDETRGVTLLGLSSKSIADGKPTDRAFALGKEIAKIALSKKIEDIYFDRNGYRYHGQVKALALGMREGGLKF